MEIVITDLTRFKNPEKVCIAGVSNDGLVLRPMPYLLNSECRRLNVHPGGVLESTFSAPKGESPHVEDASYGELRFKGPCSSDDFRKALEATRYRSMSEGFGVEVFDEQKCVPFSNPPVRSLITIKIDPRVLTIEQDGYSPNKFKAHFSDGIGTQMRFMSITDRGFSDYANAHASELGIAAQINHFIWSQDELYLRLGLSRRYETGGRDGFWIQINGIYTFPDYLKTIRQYE